MFDVDFAPGIEILWRLRQEYWGRGYATEAAKSCLAYAKENLPFSMVRAFTALTNKRSQRVMQKIGMEFEKEIFMHPAVPDGHLLKEHVLYKDTIVIGFKTFVQGRQVIKVKRRYSHWKIPPL